MNYAWRGKYPQTVNFLLESGADPSFIHRPKAKKARVIAGAIGFLIALVYGYYVTFTAKS